ncbi:hypothetical protein Trydic_g14700 [Trypoxylus dichotomus]
MTSCAICNNGLTPEKEITCDMCRNYIHTTCSGLSRTELQYLKNKDRKLSFHCPTCSDLKLQLVKLHELASTVGALESELRTLKESMTSRDVKIDPIKVPDVECIIQEVSDRQRRKNNIILYNVSENVLNNRNDQVAADMELVGELLQMLDVSVDNLRTIRLGKFDSSRTDMKRPIKVCLPDGDIASKAFQRRQKLRTSDKFKNVFLVKDKTPMQLKLYREARQELLTRKAAGETDVYIKYINDVPKVVKAGGPEN